MHLKSPINATLTNAADTRFEATVKGTKETLVNRYQNRHV